VQISNLPPFHLWRYWRAYSILLSTLLEFHNAFFFRCKQKQTWTVAPVDFLSRRPKYNKCCAAVWVTYSIQSLFVTNSCLDRNTFSITAPSFPIISNSREADGYRYLTVLDDSTTISVRLGFRRAHLLQHAITIGGVSVRLSVCPAHTGNTSKLMTIGPCGVHHRAAQERLVFKIPAHSLDPRGTHL